MKEYIEMRVRKTEEVVHVYNIQIVGETSYATIFNANMAIKSGNGWQTVKMSTLLPMDFYINSNFGSKTKKNKIKSRLKLISAEWQCTDGTVFTHEHLEDAINYEAALMNVELEGE